MAQPSILQHRCVHHQQNEDTAKNIKNNHLLW